MTSLTIAVEHMAPLDAGYVTETGDSFLFSRPANR
jgi:hypothetical protein